MCDLDRNSESLRFCLEYVFDYKLGIDNSSNPGYTQVRCPVLRHWVCVIDPFLELPKLLVRLFLSEIQDSGNEVLLVLNEQTDML